MNHFLSRALRSCAGALESFAAPQCCPCCGECVVADEFLCASCEARIPRLADALCVRCLIEEREPVHCRRHPRGARSFAAWIYDERAAEIVQAIKFGGRPELAKRHAGAIAKVLPRGYRPDMVTPVPLHATRLRERGYDQAALLSDALARLLGAPCVPGLLVRTRATREQSRLPARARRANLAGAFMVPRPEAVRGRAILIVDDVLTTGSTLDAAGTVLRAAGADTLGAALAWAA